MENMEIIIFCEEAVTEVISLSQTIDECCITGKKKVAGGIFHTLIYWPSALQLPQLQHLTEIKEKSQSKGQHRTGAISSLSKNSNHKEKSPS